MPGRYYIDPNLLPIDLPTRGENINIVAPANTNVFPQTIPNSAGIDPSFNFADSITSDDYFETYAKSTLTDYVTIKIRGRKDSYNTDRDLVYRFLINPESLTISRDTIDAQSMTRAGWQMGVWGENFIKISGKGTTAGQYFASTLNDAFGEYSASYRNMQSLVTLFENNGYWFEGEQFDNGPLSSNLSRRRIKKHSDVIFQVGNFIWFGMFQSLTVTETADTPFFNTFSFNFIAWKERYSQSSPWTSNMSTSDNYLGHAYELKTKQTDLVKSDLKLNTEYKNTEIPSLASGLKTDQSDLFSTPGKTSGTPATTTLTIDSIKNSEAKFPLITETIKMNL